MLVLSAQAAILGDDSPFVSPCLALDGALRRYAGEGEGEGDKIAAKLNNGFGRPSQ